MSSHLGGEAYDSRTRTLLVVDDLPDICEYFLGLARRVRSFDVQATGETSGQRAVELVRAQKFDVIISDFRMREFDGVDVLAAARQFHPLGRRILMSGYNEIPTTIDRIRLADVDAYLHKPLKTQEILLLLQDFLGNNQETLAACRLQARELELIALREEYPMANVSPSIITSE